MARLYMCLVGYFVPHEASHMCCLYLYIYLSAYLCAYLACIFGCRGRASGGQVDPGGPPLYD